jgi:hypothetical protein
LSFNSTGSVGTGTVVVTVVVVAGTVVGVELEGVPGTVVGGVDVDVVAGGSGVVVSAGAAVVVTETVGCGVSVGVVGGRSAQADVVRTTTTHMTTLDATTCGVEQEPDRAAVGGYREFSPERRLRLTCGWSELARAASEFRFQF